MSSKVSYTSILSYLPLTGSLLKYLRCHSRSRSTKPFPFLCRTVPPPILIAPRPRTVLPQRTQRSLILTGSAISIEKERQAPNRARPLWPTWPAPQRTAQQLPLPCIFQCFSNKGQRPQLVQQGRDAIVLQSTHLHQLFDEPSDQIQPIPKNIHVESGHGRQRYDLARLLQQSHTLDHE